MLFSEVDLFLVTLQIVIQWSETFKTTRWYVEICQHASMDMWHNMKILNDSWQWINQLVAVPISNNNGCTWFTLRLLTPTSYLTQTHRDLRAVYMMLQVYEVNVKWSLISFLTSIWGIFLSLCLGFVPVTLSLDWISSFVKLSPRVLWILKCISLSLFFVQFIYTEESCQGFPEIRLTVTLPGLQRAAHDIELIKTRSV